MAAITTSSLSLLSPISSPSSSTPPTSLSSSFSPLSSSLLPPTLLSQKRKPWLPRSRPSLSSKASASPPSTTSTSPSPPITSTSHTPPLPPTPPTILTTATTATPSPPSPSPSPSPPPSPSPSPSPSRPPPRMLEAEQILEEAPESLLRADEKNNLFPGSKSSMRVQFERMIRAAQDGICQAVEEADGGKFRQDSWIRPGGGGGISRVLTDGAVWEKAGVNVSAVYGNMPREAYRAATGGEGGGDSVPFFAAGISSVMHPRNPFAPTMHFNYRYFETDAPQGVEGAPRAWWFGGGTDLTPSYLFEEDVKHFHQVQKDVCDKHDPAFYPKFKKWCDDYFLIKHRDERRGLGGIFFDDLNDRDPEDLLAFATDCANAVVPAYLPLVVKRKDSPFTPQQKDWQQLRRGRYVEFNLVYDRGTTFGLKTGGRIESILMSLPLTARWEYDQKPEEGSEEAKLLEACRNPPDWC